LRLKRVVRKGQNDRQTGSYQSLPLIDWGELPFHGKEMQDARRLKEVI
jgi:hypothetical protein